jgi:hypothetical protein
VITLAIPIADNKTVNVTTDNNLTLLILVSPFYDLPGLKTGTFLSETPLIIDKKTLKKTVTMRIKTFILRKQFSL